MRENGGREGGGRGKGTGVTTKGHIASTPTKYTLKRETQHSPLPSPRWSVCMVFVRCVCASASISFYYRGLAAALDRRYKIDPRLSSPPPPPTLQPPNLAFLALHLRALRLQQRREEKGSFRGTAFFKSLIKQCLKHNDVECDNIVVRVHTQTYANSMTSVSYCCHLFQANETRLIIIIHV